MPAYEMSRGARELLPTPKTERQRMLELMEIIDGTRSTKKDRTTRPEISPEMAAAAYGDFDGLIEKEPEYGITNENRTAQPEISPEFADAAYGDFDGLLAQLEKALGKDEKEKLYSEGEPATFEDKIKPEEGGSGGGSKKTTTKTPSGRANPKLMAAIADRGYTDVFGAAMLDQELRKKGIESNYAELLKDSGDPVLSILKDIKGDKQKTKALAAKIALQKMKGRNDLAKERIKSDTSLKIADINNMTKMDINSNKLDQEMINAILRNMSQIKDLSGDAARDLVQRLLPAARNKMIGLRITPTEESIDQIAKDTIEESIAADVPVFENADQIMQNYSEQFRKMNSIK